MATEQQTPDSVARDWAGSLSRRRRGLAVREVQHAHDSVLGDFQFNVEHRTDVYSEQRGLEDVLYNRYPGVQAANGGFNVIRAIGPSNPNIDVYRQAAAEYLGLLGGS